MPIDGHASSAAELEWLGDAQRNQLALHLVAVPIGERRNVEGFARELGVHSTRYERQLDGDESCVERCRRLEWIYTRRAKTERGTAHVELGSSQSEHVDDPLCGHAQPQVRARTESKGQRIIVEGFSPDWVNAKPLGAMESLGDSAQC